MCQIRQALACFIFARCAGTETAFCHVNSAMEGVLCQQSRGELACPFTWAMRDAADVAATDSLLVHSVTCRYLAGFIKSGPVPRTQIAN
ncbi:hypothetical protein WJX75_005795 [Coccomyxa subellipsoidea]|uniref:Secreted protein n=1 Tax=Coccomyxa subellipsoidea TaxID=248742 RepID=A0ABR2YVT8_9CHLO